VKTEKQGTHENQSFKAQETCFPMRHSAIVLSLVRVCRQQQIDGLIIFQPTYTIAEFA